MTVVFAWLRNGFYAGLGLVLLLGIYLLWLWQPERQVRRHTQHLFKAVEKRSWTRLGEFVAPDFIDQWGDDRARLLERTREFLRYVHVIHISSAKILVQTQHRHALWTGNIIIEGDSGEITTELKSRVNSLATPFELEWRRLTVMPWDWKLARVSNPSLEIPTTD